MQQGSRWHSSRIRALVGGFFVYLSRRSSARRVGLVLPFSGLAWHAASCCARRRLISAKISLGNEKQTGQLRWGRVLQSRVWAARAATCTRTTTEAFADFEITLWKASQIDVSHYFCFHFLPVFALKLSNELPLLFVHIKIDAPVWYHLKKKEIKSLELIWFPKFTMYERERERETHSSAVSLCQSGSVASDQFVLLILSAGTVNTTATHTTNRKVSNCNITF